MTANSTVGRNALVALAYLKSGENLIEQISQLSLPRINIAQITEHMKQKEP